MSVLANNASLSITCPFFIIYFSLNLCDMLGFNGTATGPGFCIFRAICGEYSKESGGRLSVAGL